MEDTGRHDGTATRTGKAARHGSDEERAWRGHARELMDATGRECFAAGFAAGADRAFDQVIALLGKRQVYYADSRPVIDEIVESVNRLAASGLPEATDTDGRRD